MKPNLPIAVLFVPRQFGLALACSAAVGARFQASADEVLNEAVLNKQGAPPGAPMN